MPRGAQIAALATFAALLGATTAFLWNAHRLSLMQQFAIAGLVVALLWGIGWLSERRARDVNVSVFSR